MEDFIGATSLLAVLLVGGSLGHFVVTFVGRRRLRSLLCIDVEMARCPNCSGDIQPQLDAKLVKAATICGTTSVECSCGERSIWNTLARPAVLVDSTRQSKGSGKSNSKVKFNN